MGLRLTEALDLMIKDIDSDHNRVHIRQGKGRKDRYVTMPNRTLFAMRLFWQSHRHKKYIFPAGRSAEEQHAAVKYMSSAGLQKSIKTIALSSTSTKTYPYIRYAIHTPPTSWRLA
jgi:integrase